MKIRLLLFLSALLISSSVANGQYFSTGQDPAGLKWLQIKTGKFTVVYPEKYGTEGIEFAKSLDRSASALSGLFPEKKFRIPVVIHNFTTEANGYVAWAPRRMELFPTPEQNTIPLDNKTQLTLHELAHVMQMESLNTGTARVLSFVLGEQIVGAFAALLPLWYMEGDAVFSESVLSGSGRGRSPDFQKKLKAIAVEKGNMFKYDKLVDGSYRDFVPDHYQSGYQVIAWSLSSRDLQLWNRTLKFVANEPFTINPVNVYLRKNAGFTKKRLITEAFDTLKTLWEKDIRESGAKAFEPLNPGKKKEYVNYYCPVSAGADSIIAIKTSLYSPPAFVLVNPSKKTEKRIHIPGIIYPYYFSYAKGHIAWVEMSVDARWSNREYSLVRVLDLKSGISRLLSKKSRYMSAAISPDGSKIAVSENSYDNRNSLVMLSSSDGSVMKSYLAPGNASIQRPQWSADGTHITVILLTDAGEGISLFNPATGTWETLIGPARNDLQSSVIRNDTLFFTSSVSGVENGFLRVPGGTIYAITNSRFGVNDMSLSGSSVLFSDYTSSGNDICMAPLPKMPLPGFIPVNKASYLVDRFRIIHGEGANSTNEYSPEPYRKWQHLINIHSWMPFYADPDIITSEPQTIRPGATILSQNLLSTLTATVGYEYSAHKRNLLHAGFTWKGWYPVIETKLEYGDNPAIYKGSSDPAPATIYPAYNFSNTLSLPLAFYSGRFSQFIYISASANVRNNFIFMSNTAGYDIRQTQIGGRLYLYNYDRSSLRDIYPRWAQMIDILSVSWPGDKQIYGPDLYLKTAFFFPGFMRNHSIRARFETEKMDFSMYLTTNRINYPRSWINVISGKLQLYSVDYFAPLCYPDLSISSVLYLTRIRASLFYDYARGSDNYYLVPQNGSFVTDHHTAGPDTFRSFGGQLLADFHLFRIPYEITGGVQAAWKDFGAAPLFEAVFNMNINGTKIGRRGRL